MPSIHLVSRKDVNLHPVRGADGEWETGNWAITEETAAKLVGGALFLHQTKAAPSYFGGSIVSFRVLEDGDDAGRFVLRFRFDAANKGVTSSGSGWTQDKKIVE